MKESLFDVVLSNSGDPVTQEVSVGVTVIDRRKGHDGAIVVPRTEFGTLNEAMQFAREEVTAWMRRTRA